MAKVNEKIKKHLEENPGKPFFSFEYFPPKTEIGMVNLYERFERMGRLNPMWIDVTWGAGGSTSDKTMDLCVNALKYHGLDVMMHLTCTNITEAELKQALEAAKAAGICNLLALRGDPPAEISMVDGKQKEVASATGWTATEGGFAYASDLVKYIRQEYGDYFCVAVAGYPEGHLEAESFEKDMEYLKQKVDNGADMIVTQLFYDTRKFNAFVEKARAMGIAVPIIPGIMPIQSYAGFKRMTAFCKTFVPEEISNRLEEVKDDDQKVKDYGIELAVKMCTELAATNDCPGLHFYTLNLETSVLRVIDGLNLFEDWTSQRNLPWKPAVTQKRAEEKVRPIFWANRPTSYIKRTSAWDDFPNGRFGNRNSPAFGEWNFVSYSKESWQKVQKERLEMWGGEVASVRDIHAVFTSFLRNEIKRLPWCVEAPSKETNFIYKPLIKLNSLGALTINSQPRVNGSLSSDPYVGWGPNNGFVYQKAYVEFFVSPAQLTLIRAKMKEERLRSWSLCAMNAKSEVVYENCEAAQVNAVTWGIFPGSEVLQPTVCDAGSFKAWKEEAFALWNEWVEVYPEGSASRNLVLEQQQTMYLCNIVDNDFVAGDLFTLLVKILEGTPF